MNIMLLLLASLIKSFVLTPSDPPFFFESFQDDSYRNRWVRTKEPNYSGIFEVREAAPPQCFKGEKMLFTKDSKQYYGFSTMFPEPLNIINKTLIVQFEARFEHKFICDGAYIKLFQRDNFSPSNLSSKTNYVIMFGPDLCFLRSNIHFVFKHKNKLSNTYEEKRLQDPPYSPNSKTNHLFTLIIRPDNSFNILIDNLVAKSGSLLEDFYPPVKPKKRIRDPTDKMPDDWTDQEYIPDPAAQKPPSWDDTEPKYIQDPKRLKPPDGWLFDEPLTIPDPKAKRPKNWDTDLNGEWEPPTIRNPKCTPDKSPGCGQYDPPLIRNPKYRGKWMAPLIENPKYSGNWKPRKIPNPYYYDDQNPHNFGEIIGCGFELYMSDPDVGFENIYIGTDEVKLMKWNEEHFLPKIEYQLSHPKIKDPVKRAMKDKKAQEEFDTQLKLMSENAVVSRSYEEDKPFYDLSGKFYRLYNECYSENKAMTIACTLLTIMFPFIMYFIACC